MARRIAGLPLGFLLKAGMTCLGKLGGLTVPNRFFLGEADELVPVSMGQKLYEVAAEPKRLVNCPSVGQPTDRVRIRGNGCRSSHNSWTCSPAKSPTLTPSGSACAKACRCPTGSETARLSTRGCTRTYALGRSWWGFKAWRGASSLLGVARGL